MTRAQWWAAAGGALLLGALSLLLASALGYDAYAWQVWGRGLAHLSLDTTSGPSWKPLPVLVDAPLSVLGNAAPLVWLALVRAVALLALLLAYRLAARLAGTVAGWVAVVALALGADLYRTALLGSSEPLLIALALGAFELHLRGRRRWALGAIALAGLIRPEAWPFLWLYAAYLWRAEPAGRRLAVALALAPPAIWLGLDWIGSGDPLNAGARAHEPAAGSIANARFPALEVLRRSVDAVLLPVFLLGAGAAVEGLRRRDRAVLEIAGVALTWIAIVAVLSQGGYPGLQRYLAVPAALICVLAGVAVAWLFAALPGRGMRTAAASVLIVLGFAFAFAPMRQDGRLLSVARAQTDQLRELRDAVRRAGGAHAVLAAGHPAVNPWLQTALAFELRTALPRVQGTWGSTRRHPGWQPPAMVFRAPARLAGPRPALPVSVRTRPVTAAGRWRVLLATSR